MEEFGIENSSKPSNGGMLKLSKIRRWYAHFKKNFNQKLKKQEIDLI